MRRRVWDGDAPSRRHGRGRGLTVPLCDESGDGGIDRAEASAGVGAVGGVSRRARRCAVSASAMEQPGRAKRAAALAGAVTTVVLRDRSTAAPVPRWLIAQGNSPLRAASAVGPEPPRYDECYAA